MPCQSDTDGFFTRSQITIVKEAESIIMSDLSKRFTAKEYGTAPLEFRRRYEIFSINSD
ncbi:hypothetical protein [Eubacterium sp.]